MLLAGCAARLRARTAPMAADYDSLELPAAVVAAGA
eukprot:COSAG01_NODE_66588_length_269_cov_1.464706_1_plen_35_part_01